MPSNVIPSSATIGAAISKPSSGRWWLLPHLLSLDAPLVAIVWQSVFGWTLGTAVRWPETLVLYLSVWIAYAGDRVFDAWRLETRDRSSVRLGFREAIATPAARHRFSAENRSALLWAMGVALLADLWVAHSQLSADLLRTGYPLALAAIAYVGAAQFLKGFGHWWIAKELTVGLIIAAGAMWVPMAEGASAEYTLLLLCAAAWLCGWNCVAISLWEKAEPDDPSGHKGAPARARERLLAHLTVYFHQWTIVGAIAVTLLGAATGSAHGLAAGCSLGTAMLLLRAVHASGAFLSDDARRVFADVVLLVPALLLLLPR